MTDRCELTDLLPGQCGCRHHRAGTTITEEISDNRAALLLTGRWIPARYPGHCTRCGTPFGIGAAISQEPDLTWRAECCS